MARMPALDVRGRTTVVTGAAAGMGAAVARELSRRGARIALIDRDEAGLDAVRAGLSGVGHSVHVVDVTDDEAVSDAVGGIEADHDHIQALITCAGSSMLGSIDQLTMAEMRWLMDVNLWGTVNITQALLPALRREAPAHITHIASIYALAAPAGRIPYAMSKFAVRGFSEALRHELEGSAISVGTVYPAGVKTGIVLRGRYAAALDPAIAARAAAAQAALYRTEPEDAAAHIVDATVRRRARTMIGRQAGLVDALARITPAHYWRFMRGTLRAAVDTTTPIG